MGVRPLLRNAYIKYKCMDGYHKIYIMQTMQDIRTETEVSGHTESSVKAGKSSKNRSSPRLHITLSRENYEWIKNKGL